MKGRDKKAERKGDTGKGESGTKGATCVVDRRCRRVTFIKYTACALNISMKGPKQSLM